MTRSKSLDPVPAPVPDAPAGAPEAAAAASYRALLEALPEAFVAVDAAGRVCEWSARAQELFGWSAAEILGRDAQALALPKAYRAVGEEGLPVFLRREGGAQRSGWQAYRAMTRSGEEVPVELCRVAHPTAVNGSFLCMIKDVSHRVVRDERLAQVAKMEAVGQLASGLAHDFNNILGIIMGSLEALQAALDDPQTSEFVTLALLAAERGTEVTRSMQALARRRPVKAEVIDLNAAIRELAPLFERTAGRNIEVQVLPESDQARTCIDVGSFNNVLLNFVLNARDAMPGGGTLMVYTQAIEIAPDNRLEVIDLEPGPYVVVGIDDTGTGMSPEVLSRAMEPFYTTKPKGKGTGLGLAMAYAFARQCGGALRIRSTPGKGTNIHLFIPRQTSATPVVAPPPPGTPSQERSQ